MPLLITCPECDKKLRVPDNLLGKKVKCPGCGVMFQAAEEEAPPSPAPARRSAPSASGGVAPRVPPPARRPAPPPPPEEDEEEDEAPRPRRAAREERVSNAPRSRRRLEDDEEDEAPRARRRARDEEEDEDHPDRSDDGDDREEGRGARGRRAGWGKVRTGLMLVALGGWVQVGTWVVTILGLILLALTGVALFSSLAAGPRGPNAGMGAAAGFGGMAIGLILFAGIVGLLGFASTVLKLTGMGFCMAVLNPRRTSLKGLAIAAFCCAVAAVLLNWAGNILNFSSSGFNASRGGPNAMGMVMGSGGSITGLASGVAALAGIILFLLFLRGVALAVRNPQLAATVSRLMISWAIFAGASVVVGCLFFVGAIAVGASMASSGARPSSAMGALGVIGILGGLLALVAVLIGAGLYVWYILIVQQLRDAVGRYLNRMD